MAHPVTLSKSKLLAYVQCPRKLWLAQYRPELEDEEAFDPAVLEIGRAIGAKAREIYGREGGHLITGERGLRAAVAATQALVDAGGRKPIFEATFEHAGVTVQVDVLDRSQAVPKLVEVKSSTSVKEHHLVDCTVQAWTLSQLGMAPRVAVAHVDAEFVYGGDGDYSHLLIEEDVTALVDERLAQVPALVAGARATLEALDEPETAIGEQCASPYACPFFGHCAPPQREFPVTALGGLKSGLYALMHEGFGDLRDVPNDKLANDRQRRIARCTRLGRPYLGRELRELALTLPRPRYYLDFETVAFAVPIWPGTRPYEALPFQWSVHVDDGAADESSGGLAHAAYLSLSGEPPMRACAEALLETLGERGPILVYSGYERRVLGELATRYPDLAPALDSLRERLVDLLPAVKTHYYHPDMRGSWSLKSVLPTVAPDLDYGGLGEVRNGAAAQAAYLEAIAPTTPVERRERLRHALLEYCRYDTLALVRLVDFFERTPPCE